MEKMYYQIEISMNLYRVLRNIAEIKNNDIAKKKKMDL